MLFYMTENLCLAFRQGNTVHFLYIVTCGVRKWGKTKEKGGAGFETSTRFAAPDISEKYQSQIHRPLEH